MKCPRCSTPNNRGLLMAFKDGEVIVACTKHAGDTPKDNITGWLRLPKVKEVT